MPEIKEIVKAIRELTTEMLRFAVVAKSGDYWIFKTAWKKEDFDEESEIILEVLKNAGL